MHLQQLIQKFEKLHVNRSRLNGNAPHKPILLLSILQAIESGLITENRIYITPELVGLFKTNWTALVTTNHQCTFGLPFYHLQGDKIWKLQPNIGYENIVKLQNSLRSFNQLNAAIDYASFTDDIFQLLKDKTNSGILKQLLSDTYFPDTKNNLTTLPGNNYLNTLEDKILHEPATQYSAEIKELKATLTPDSYETEVFLRAGAFRREIIKPTTIPVVSPVCG